MPVALLEFDSRFAAYDVTPVTNQFILEYMPNARDGHVKVYLYGLMLCCHPREDASLASIAQDLGMTEEEVRAAFRHWEFAGLVERVRDDPPEYRYVHPVWRSFLAGEQTADPAFEAFMEDLYSAFGGKRDLHGKEKRQAWEWVQELGLAPEVVLVLVRHLIAARGLNFSFAGKEAGRLALLLADRGAATVEEALEILGQDREIEDGAAEVLQRFRQRRRASQDELELYRKWRRDWGFTRTEILDACAETTKGAPNFSYLDGILSGIRGRQGGADNAVQADREESERVREMLRALGHKNAALSKGTRAAYQQMAALYPHPIILLAAEACGRQQKGLDDVIAGLESWKRRGLETEEEVRAFMAQFDEESRLIAAIGGEWGKRVAAGGENRALVRRWLDSLGMSEAMILHCAKYAGDAAKGMPYLDRVLSAMAEQGVTTPEAAEAVHEAWKQRQGKAAAGQKPAKTVIAQQYDQRDYGKEPARGLPEWMLEEWKEMQNGEQ